MVGRIADDGAPYQGRPSVSFGSRVADYELRHEIGRGGTGVVYCATDLRLDRTVALKLLRPELARNETFRRRLIHAARVVNEIDHPHMVPTFEAGESDGTLYIAMRYIHAPNLRELLNQDRALAVAPAMRIAEHVASALDSAHAHGLVHGTVKPGKVLVVLGEDDGLPLYAYLTGFGTAGSLPDKDFGSLGVDAAVDQYALACLVYETFAGEPVFPQGGDEGVRRLQQQAEPRPLSQTCPELPPDVDGVMRTALAKAPSDRYRSCREFVSELRAAVEGRDRP
ncbi:hypothetical protein ADK90_10645 [Streptomyces sp. XY413]|nr:hypothetical protein ADK90_10645 [Streptomyces sp. XY413]